MRNGADRECFYNKTVEQVEKIFETDRGCGLSSDAIQKKRREYGLNDIYKTYGNNSKKIFIPFDFTALLLLAVLFIASLFEVPVASGAIVLMLIANYGAALFTYFKAHKVLDGMTAYSLPTAKVLRNGKPVLMEMRLLVPGDVVFLSTGDIVPADLRLFHTEGLFINEGMVTGIQSSRLKDAAYENFAHMLPVEKMENMAFASTVVTAGSGRGIVVATGENTAAAKMGKIKPLGTHENLSILKTLKKYCSVWSMSMLVLVFVITVINLFAAAPNGIFDVFLAGVSLAVAAMSELYVVFGYIIIGCGIFSAMKRRRETNTGALIKNAEKLEELKNITTLIIPKDGVITSSNCTVDKIYTSRTLYSAGDTDRLDKIRSTVLAGVISTGIYGMGLTSLNKNSRRITPEEEALIRAAEALSLYNSDIDRLHPIIEHMPAGEASKFETTLTVDSDKQYMAVCRGDAELILNACRYYTENGRIYKMTTDDRLEFVSRALSLVKSSYRVVAVATGVTGYNNLRRIGSIQSDLTFEGLIAIKEPLAPHVARTIARCKAAGIKVIMTTDRYKENDKFLAMSIGIIENESGILTGDVADSMNSDMLRTNLPLYSMFTGISIKKMADIISMMRADGECVGLLAGGMNSALLLRRADVGFAQSTTISPKAGKNGIDLRSRRGAAYSSISGGNVFDSEALKFISDVVVSDADDKEGGFTAVVSALEYSRTIYKNLLRMVNYLTTSQLSRIFLTIGALILGINALTPIQLIFSGLVLDLAAIVSSAFSKPPYSVLSLRNETEKSLEKPLAMNVRSCMFALIEAVVILVTHPILTGIGVTFTPEQFISASFIAFIACRFITFIELATEKSIFRSELRIGMSFVMFLLGLCVFTAVSLIFPGFGTVLNIVRLPLALTVSTIAVAASILVMHEAYKQVSK